MREKSAGVVCGRVHVVYAHVGYRSSKHSLMRLYCSGADPSGSPETVSEHVAISVARPQDGASRGVRWILTGNACRRF
jgi:hypothetical protein